MHASHASDANIDAPGSTAQEHKISEDSRLSKCGAEEKNDEINSKGDLGKGGGVVKPNSPTRSGPKLVSFRSIQMNKFSSSFVDTEESMAQSVIIQQHALTEDSRRKHGGARARVVPQADNQRDGGQHPGVFQPPP